MREDKILFVDTETGGLEPDKDSLLTLALVVWQGFEIIDYTEILINDGILKASKEALRINKINLEEHKKEGLAPNVAIIKIEEFLAKHFESNEKITLAGHNVNFDVNFLKFFMTKNNYEFSKKFSHRFVDTSSILYYLYLSGKMKYKMLSSQEAFDFLGIKVAKRHSALGDAMATAKMFSLLLKMIYKGVKLSGVKKEQKSLFEFQ